MKYGPYSVTNGLILHLDASNSISFTSGSLTWSNMANKSNNFAITGSTVLPNFTSSGTLSSFNTYFLTSSTYSHSFFNAIDETSELLGILYQNHTIECVINPKNFDSLYNYNNALNNENLEGIIIWPGFHSGLSLISSSTLQYIIWNSSSNQIGPTFQLTSSQNKITHIVAMRSGTNMYIYVNGNLTSSASISSPTAYPYADLRIGTALASLPTGSTFTWPADINIYTIKVYNRALSNLELSQSYNNVKTRFGV